MSTKKSAAIRFLEKITGGSITLGRFLESVRLGEEMTQPEFAKKLGISKSHLNDIEKGRKAVSPDRAARFAEVLGYSAVALAPAKEQRGSDDVAWPARRMNFLLDKLY